jgi:hypothetical protein
MITKTLFLATTVLLSIINVQAQYKKITMKERIGNVKSHSGLLVGGNVHFMGNGKGNPASFSIGFISIAEEKRWFFGMALTGVLPVKFSYATKGYYYNGASFGLIENQVTMTGKTNPVFLGELNWGCFLHNVSNANAKVKPFLTFGFNGHIGGGINKNSTNRDKLGRPYATFLKDISFAAAGIGVKAGGGVLLPFNNAIALKLDGGYNVIGNLSFHSPDTYGSPPRSYYHAYTSNPYGSAGVVLQFGRSKK